MRTLINIAGKTFGRWTVVEYFGYDNGHPLWWCVCSCGTRSLVCGWTLRTGTSTSCGCARRAAV